MTPDVSLSTPDLVLEPLTTEAADGPYLEWMNDGRICRFLETDAGHSASDLRGYIEHVRKSVDSVLFGMFQRDDRRHVGNIKLGPISRRHERGDIGLIVDPAFWGRGYATQAIAAVAGYGLETLGLHKITASCYGSNPGSARAFVKAGFTEEGRRPHQFLDQGAWVDQVLLGRVNPVGEK